MSEKICPLDGNWQLDTVNSDEFDGDLLDFDKWYDFAPGWRGREEFIYRKANVSVGGGSLLMEARRIDPSEMEPEDRANGILPFTMPIVKSKNKVRYGYFECCAKGCNAEVRNAFWLYDPLSDDLEKKHSPGDWSEEIDIYEFIGKFKHAEHPPYLISAAVHRFATPYTEGIVNWVKTDLPGWHKVKYVTESPADDFHTYGLLWTPDEIVWYVDGEEYHRRENDYFHRPLHIVFDCEHVDWEGAKVENFTSDRSPAVHEVKYFRRWTLTE